VRRGESGLPPNVAFVFGVAVALISSAMQALGMNMQRLTFLKEQAKPLNDQRPVWKSWIWIVGLIVYMISQLGGQPVALGTGDHTPLPCVRLCVYISTRVYVRLCAAPLYAGEGASLLGVVCVCGGGGGGR
jgi:hypothetical protein